ncbi:hypothetical protein J2785_001318 [Burkholderia ambifaria]|nr:hypothetical protein [Burkholderia ambifaria]MDR6498174.1 hypothetical protein [Burkholderia ambifaria]
MDYATVGRCDKASQRNSRSGEYFLSAEWDATTASSEVEPYRRAEAMLNACITRVELGERCLVLGHELATVERFLVWLSTTSSLPQFRGIATCTLGNGCHITSWPASARRLQP